MTTLTTDDVTALAPSNNVVITAENREDVRRTHAHPFTSEYGLKVGDVLWTPYAPMGNHIVVVWLSEQRAGLGRNGDTEPMEGPVSVVGGELVIDDEKHGRFRLRDGTKI